jgi:hypothetical protein
MGGKGRRAHALAVQYLAPMRRPWLAIWGWFLLVSGACADGGLVFNVLCCRTPGAARCASTEPVPADQEALMHWFWKQYETATDAQVHEAVTNMHHAIHGEDLTQPAQGSLGALGAGDIGNVDTSNTDPSPATGLLLADAMDCSVDNAERITTYHDQSELYPGIYDSYARTYDTSLPEYLARQAPTVQWSVATSGSLAGNRYTMRYGGGDRFVPGQPGSAAVGPVLLNRTWLKEPAHFDNSADAIPQDYQIEVYYEHAPGKLVHLWADWRQVKKGTLTNNDDLVLGILLDNMGQWDNQTRTLCSQNRPPPP